MKKLVIVLGLLSAMPAMADVNCTVTHMMDRKILGETLTADNPNVRIKAQGKKVSIQIGNEKYENGADMLVEGSTISGDFRYQIFNPETYSLIVISGSEGKGSIVYDAAFSAKHVVIAELNCE